MRSLFACWLAFACSLALAAVQPTRLDAYLTGLKTLRTDFEQTVVDSRGREVQRDSGSLLVERPGRFRWSLRDGKGQPAQVLVGDGLNLWFYDIALEQVTVKPAASTLPGTPAMLLAGEAPIRESFLVRALPRQQGLDWVEVRPRRSDAEFAIAKFGFARNVLVSMRLTDKLGQVTTVKFNGAARNVALDPDEFRFSAPQGVDVIGTPASPSP
ncbi:MAG: outer membrane lipoprotein chaperone LolA [Steroidobacteraceae bacterium]